MAYIILFPIISTHKFYILILCDNYNIIIVTLIVA